MLGAVPSAAPQSSPVDLPADLAALTAGFIRRELVVDAAVAQRDLSLTVLSHPDAAGRSARLVAATESTLRRFTEWFGPFPLAHLTVIDAPWSSHLAGAAFRGVVITTSRWYEPATDRTLERFLIGAVARQYWMTDASEPARQWLSEGLTLYSAVRGIHEELGVRHFATIRLFGGFIPLMVREVAWSPGPTDPRPGLRHFAEVDQPAVAPWRQWSAAPGSEAQRVALTLHTLERYIGWPATQQILAALQSRKRVTEIGPDDLAAITSEQRGRDTSWLFSEALRFDARFDYGITAFTSDAIADRQQFHTHVTFRRHGDGVFAGTSEPPGAPFAKGRSLPVVVRFEDGTDVREWWDGRDADFTRDYVARSRGASASVDPEAMLLLDQSRANNSLRRNPEISDAGVQLATRWVVWLQDLMLSWTGLI